MADIFRMAVLEVGKLSGDMISKCGSDTDAVRVAVALMHAAETIFVHLRGPRLAAAQFADFADRLSRNQQ